MSSVTQLSANSFQFERERQRFLMLNGALLVGASQAFLGEAEVETSAFRLFEAVHAASIPHYFGSDEFVFRVIRASNS